LNDLKQKYYEAKTHLRIVGIIGLIKAIRAYLTNTTVLHEVKRRECRSPFWLRLGTSDILTCRQVFINKEYEFGVSCEPAVILDAGANIGLASIYFANRYPNAKIISVEPEDTNFQLLEKNTAGYPNILPLKAALWHKNEKISLKDPGIGKWGYITESPESLAGTAGEFCHMVDGKTVRSIMETYGLRQINIFKVDIEGSEKEVFSDSSDWIDQVQSIIVELHDRVKQGCSRSFYNGTNGFDDEWIQGENVYLSRDSYLTRTPLG
jgi:FkbM family methyltransferase